MVNVTRTNRITGYTFLDMKKQDINWRKCKHCGKLLSYKQLEEQNDVMFVFIPETSFTIEESYFVHVVCW